MAQSPEISVRTLVVLPAAGARRRHCTAGARTGCVPAPDPSCPHRYRWHPEKNATQMIASDIAAVCVCSASAWCPRGVCRGRGGRSRLSRAARIRFCCAQRRAAAESKLSARRMRRSAFRRRSQGWGSSCNGRGGGAAVARQAGRCRQAGRRLAGGPAGPRTLQSCPHHSPVRPPPGKGDRPSSEPPKR